VVLTHVLQLAPPQKPELREAVQEEDRLAFAAGDVVHPAFGEIREVMFEVARLDRLTAFHDR
jgi:hypothetical protein